MNVSKTFGLFETGIGKKLLMALTGLFLCSFLIIHASINACIFANDSGALFNAAAYFMAHNIVIRVVEIGLFAGLVLHVVQSASLTMKNRNARPINYVKNNGNANSKWYSRSMGVLGSLLLLFLIVHLNNFWVPTKAALMNNTEHNTFEGLKEVFSLIRFLVSIRLPVCYSLQRPGRIVQSL